jgi:mono/diheme cytochrome c family protein
MKRAVLVLAVLCWPLTAGADSFEEHDYILNCAGCHRMDGTGSRTVPSLLAMRELRGKAGAREYWVQVPGAAQAPLSDQRLADLMNWLLERFAGERPKPAYSPEEVKRLRKEPLRDPVAKREKIRQAP